MRLIGVVAVNMIMMAVVFLLAEDSGTLVVHLVHLVKAKDQEQAGLQLRPAPPLLRSSEAARGSSWCDRSAGPLG